MTACLRDEFLTNLFITGDCHLFSICILRAVEGKQNKTDLPRIWGKNERYQRAEQFLPNEYNGKEILKDWAEWAWLDVCWVRVAAR